MGRRGSEGEELMSTYDEPIEEACRVTPTTYNTRLRQLVRLYHMRCGTQHACGAPGGYSLAGHTMDEDTGIDPTRTTTLRTHNSTKENSSLDTAQHACLIQGLSPILSFFCPPHVFFSTDNTRFSCVMVGHTGAFTSAMHGGDGVSFCAGFR